MIRDDLFLTYLRDSNAVKVEILLNAIEYMHQYNDRSVGDCIKLAVNDYHELGLSTQDCYEST